MGKSAKTMKSFLLLVVTVATTILSRDGSALIAPQPTTTRREWTATAFGTVAGTILIATAAPQNALAEPRPTYLSEPTEEFLDNEKKAMEFKRKEIMLKKEFNALLDKFLGEADDEEALVQDINALQKQVAKAGGLPAGLKKEELFKMIRSKKGKGFWPTRAEVAYQSLIGEIRFQQSPNMDKENGNPFQ